MARTSALETKSAIRTMGAAFIALVLFLVWVTYAFFEKKFTDYDDVTIVTTKTGVNLPQNADVKLRGMIVGEVRGIEPAGDGVRITMGMNPKLIGDVPADVSAQIVPKTLFGEKYIALIPSDDASNESLQAGDTIDQAEVPIEVEELLNDAYPLLTAVDPQNLSTTLTAVSDALDGRGEELGETLVTANEYITALNPDVPQLVDDLVAFGEVAEIYGDAMPDLGATLRNVTVTGNTVVAKRAQLAAFFDEGTRLANTLTEFTEDNGDNLVTLADDGRPVLEMLGDYSVAFPCFLKGMRNLIPGIDSAFRGDRLHINLRVVPEPTAYAADENIEASQQDLKADAAQPTCLGLNELNRNVDRLSGDARNDYLANNEISSQAHPFTVPPEVYKLVNVQSGHNKFGPDSEYNRSAVTSLVQPSLAGIDTPAERDALASVLGASLGVPASDVPDLGTLMIGPILRGAEVTAE